MLTEERPEGERRKPSATDATKGNNLQPLFLVLLKYFHERRYELGLFEEVLSRDLAFVQSALELCHLPISEAISQLRGTGTFSPPGRR